jgi:hypothetical protein
MSWHGRFGWRAIDALQMPSDVEIIANDLRGSKTVQQRPYQHGHQSEAKTADIFVNAVKAAEYDRQSEWP